MKTYRLVILYAFSVVASSYMTMLYVQPELSSQIEEIRSLEDKIKFERGLRCYVTGKMWVAGYRDAHLNLGVKISDKDLSKIIRVGLNEETECRKEYGL